jgi:hypothetical protein
MRVTSLLGVLAITASVTFVPGAATTGDVVIADPYAEYFQRGKVKFDDVQQVLIAHRRPHDRADPAVAWVDVEGFSGGRINPLKEFPKADAFDIWAVAAGPQSVLVSGVVQAGERALRLPPRHVILTYDLAGTLRHEWVMNPWHVHEMAVDRAGSVYTLGDRIDGHSANLIRKYSRDGVLEREFMPAAMFPHGENATSAERGSNQLWVEGERLCAYMADIDGLLEFDFEGKQQRRTSFREALARLARDHGGVRADLLRMANDGRDASLLAQVRVWSEGGKGVALVLARLPLDGARPQSLESTDGTELGTSQFPLLGRSGDAVLFLNRYTATILRR